jgi:hypothetical protein
MLETNVSGYFANASPGTDQSLLPSIWMSIKLQPPCYACQEGRSNTFLRRKWNCSHGQNFCSGRERPSVAFREAKGTRRSARCGSSGGWRAEGFLRRPSIHVGQGACAPARTPHAVSVGNAEQPGAKRSIPQDGSTICGAPGNAAVALTRDNCQGRASTFLRR